MGGIGDKGGIEGGEEEQLEDTRGGAVIGQGGVGVGAGGEGGGESSSETKSMGEVGSPFHFLEAMMSSSEDSSTSCIRGLFLEGGEDGGETRSVCNGDDDGDGSRAGEVGVGDDKAEVGGRCTGGDRRLGYFDFST